MQKIKRLEETWHDKYLVNIVGRGQPLQTLLKELHLKKVPYETNYPLSKKWRMITFNKKYSNIVKRLSKRYKNVGCNVDVVTFRKEILKQR